MANKRQTRYTPPIKNRLFEKRTANTNKRIIPVLMRGSRACRKPPLAAYSSENTDSFKKDRAPSRERSMKLRDLRGNCIFLFRSGIPPVPQSGTGCGIKLFFLNTDQSPFFVKILPKRNTARIIATIPTAADII